MRRSSWLAPLVHALSVALAILVGTSAVFALTAREILDEAERLDDTTRKWTDRTQTMVLHIHGKRGGERTRTLKVFDKRYPDDGDKSVSFFLEPPEVRDTAFLQWAHKDRDDDQWLYLPEFKRTRRITARIRDQSFMGTDFSYRDLEILGEIQEWTEAQAPATLVGEEKVDGHDCHVIALSLRQTDMPYGKIVLWMEKGKLVPRKMDFHDEKGTLVKSLSLGDIRDIGPVPSAHRMEMRNVEKGSRTVVIPSDVAFDAGLSDDLFTERQLRRGSP